MTGSTIIVGESYKFYLDKGENITILEGQVTYKDDKVITIYNENFGESEFEIKDSSLSICTSNEKYGLSHLDLDLYNSISCKINTI